MFPALVLDKLRSEGLGLRDGAAVVGVSHTTMARAIQGMQVDIPTILRLCNWLHISPASALNSMAIVREGEPFGEDKLAASIAILVQREPGLASVFQKAVEQVEKGTLKPKDVQEIISFAAFRLTREDTE